VHIRHLAAVVGLAATLFTGPAFALTEVVVDYAIGSRTPVYEAIARSFMAEHPDIKITFRLPSTNYEEGHEGIVRQSMVNQLPDVHFSSYNQYAALVDRGLAVDLGPLMADLPSYKEQGFFDSAMNLVTIRGKVYGLPFLSGTTIILANGDLVRRAGGSCKALPKTWDEFTDLAARIRALDPTYTGGTIASNDDWLFQAVIYSAGGKMLTNDGRDVAFDGAEGKKAMLAVDRFAKASGMANTPFTSTAQSFAAGRVGMWIYAGELISRLQPQMPPGTEFCTGTFPAIDPQRSLGAPTGGAAAVIMTKDAQKQKAAFEFIRFATGAKGQAILVEQKGYPPINARAFDIPSVKTFFETHPERQPDLEQVKVGMPWAVFPGDNSVRIVRVIRDNFDRVLLQTSTPELALENMAKQVRALLPGR
jgi:multiple sugar transport system substrate-binding protein